jgi:type IV pilus assembly protein PilN
MAHINLLPWREERRKEKQQEFLVFLGFTAAIAAILVFFVHVQVQGMITYQDARNTYLQNEIKILDKRIAEIKKLEKQKAALVERMKIVEELQASRPGVVHMFDQLVTTLTEGNYLASVTQKGSSLTLEGQADSNARVSSYMNQLDASDWFKDSELSVTKSSKKGVAETQDFKLTVKQSSPAAKQKEKGEQ